MGVLAVKSRRPHHHPNEHVKEEIDLIKRYHKRNPTSLSFPNYGIVSEKNKVYTPSESLYRVMKKLGMLPKKPKKATYKPKPYEQMTYPRTCSGGRKDSEKVYS